MKTDIPSSGVLIRFRRPPRRRSAGFFNPALAPRIEGSLAGVALLAPVIPIFPALALAAQHRSAAPVRQPTLG